MENMQDLQELNKRQMEQEVDEVQMFNNALELQRYIDNLESGNVSKEDKIASENTKRLMTMSMDEFFNGEFDKYVE